MTRATTYPAEDVVQQYIEDVLSGRLPACKWVRLMCQRHLDDLEHGHERGFWFNPDAASLVIEFFGLLHHSKGEWAGQVIRLEPWQQTILWILFGWMKEDGTRRFRTSYLEVSRKNGKSTIAAGIGLYLMVADGEPGAEIYSAATKRDQARITHAEAVRMVKGSAALRKRVTVYRDNLHIAGTASKYEPLGRNSDSMDGLNVHGAVVDEVHAHKTRELWDVLETATGARRQPLMFSITTAGYDRKSICFVQHEYTQKVLEGIVEDDSWFGVIFTIDEDDQWDDEAAWIKANPNLGVSKKVDDMRRLAARAKEMPSQLNAFLRLHLDVWTQAETKWVPWGHWDACGVAVDATGLRGRTCYAGLDLSSTTDVTALVLVFPPQVEGDAYQILTRFWIPEEAMHERSHRDRVPYDDWVRRGYIVATPGNAVDQDFAVAQVDDDAQTYDLQEVAYDRWGAANVIQKLQDMGGDDFVVPFGQGFKDMSPPMKELERLILSHRLAHGNNPVLNWMADNLVAREDPAGNIKPDKERSIEKIDGMVALIMALDRAIRHGSNRSIYEERGLIVL
jgi:phage terminase large subunit-like protein